MKCISLEELTTKKRTTGIHISRRKLQLHLLTARSQIWRTKWAGRFNHKACGGRQVQCMLYWRCLPQVNWLPWGGDHRLSLDHANGDSLFHLVEVMINTDVDEDIRGQGFEQVERANDGNINVYSGACVHAWEDGRTAWCYGADSSTWIGFLDVVFPDVIYDQMDFATNKLSSWIRTWNILLMW